MRTLKEALFIAMVIAGLVGGVAFATANMFVPIMINDIHIAIANGVPVNEFSKLIFGLNVNGQVRFIDVNLAALLSVTCLLVAYFGLQGFLLSRKGLSLGHLFSKRYWSFFNWSFYYSVRLNKTPQAKK